MAVEPLLATRAQRAFIVTSEDMFHMLSKPNRLTLLLLRSILPLAHTSLFGDRFMY